MTLRPPHPLAGFAKRRRGEALERAITEAVLAQLREGGYGSVTMEGVAADAGTGKAALYRRWASRDDLVVDIVSRCLGKSGDLPGDLPDTGTVRGDLLELLGGLANLVNSPAGGAACSASGRHGPGRELADLMSRKVVEPKQRMIVEVLRRGVDRGEVRPDAPLGLVAELGPSMLLKRLLVDGPPVPGRFVTELVDELMLPMLRPRDGSA